MNALKSYVTSSIFKKAVTALTGLALVVFVVLHLVGNLLLLSPKGDLFNAYAEKLASYGVLLTVAEIGLLAVFLVHIVNGIRLKWTNLQARPVGYRVWKSKHGPTFANSSSLYMIWSGAILLVFLILHLIQFRFGPGIKDGYNTLLNGLPARDLYRVVVEVFHDPFMVFFYLLAMVFLGLHLRHGFWSAFQSLGVSSPRVHQKLVQLGVLLSVILSFGFLLIPVWIFFDIGKR